GFYTDCFRKGYWSEPDKLIDETMARAFMLVAETLSNSKGDVTEREMELWMEIVGPFIDTKEAPAKLLDWHRAMLKEGLTDIPLETARRFIFGADAEHTRDYGDRLL